MVVAHNMDVPTADEVWPEDARLAALHDLNILDTPSEVAFERLTHFLRRMFNAPIALVSFIDRDRQWIKAGSGIGVTEISRANSFCSLALETPDRPFVILDAAADARYADNPLVTGAPGVRFYAGAALRTPNGAPVGAVCVMDTAPRAAFPDKDCDNLSDVAALAASELVLRETASEFVRKVEEIEDVIGRLRDEKERNERELGQAVEAQRRILPPSYRRLASAEAYAMLAPSRTLSGDSYGYGRLNDESCFFWIADVVGHGVGAALLAATLSRVVTGEMLMATRQDPPPPAEVLKRLNTRLMNPGEEEYSYFTMLYGMLNRRERTLKFSTAGHPPPLLMLPGQDPVVVEGSGLPLALFNGADYETVEVDFPPGARLLTYSDGISECEAQTGEQFETDRLLGWMNDTRSSDPAVALGILKGRLRRWRGDLPFADDITAVLIERGQMTD